VQDYQLTLKIKTIRGDNKAEAAAIKK